MDSRSTVAAYREDRPSVTWAVDVPDDVAAAYLAAQEAWDAAQEALWEAVADQQDAVRDALREARASQRT